jgi:glucose-6-phosphate isomerase
MPYIQRIDDCLVPSIGNNGLDLSVFLELLAQTDEALRSLKQAHDDNTLPLLRWPAREDDLNASAPIVARFASGATDICLLGAGGSSLGAQALAQLTGWRTPGGLTQKAVEFPRLHFFDNLDAMSLTLALRTLDLKTTRFLVISKSGSTAETLMQMLSCVAAIESAGLGWNLGQHFLGITEPAVDGESNVLRRLCSQWNIDILDHDPRVGGRFSVLTNVGMVPAILMGLDARAIRAGAQEVLTPLLNGASAAEFAPAQGAALSVGLAQVNNHTATVMLPYADRLQSFSRWFVQLWAESLGKQGQGTLPVAAIGPSDQHSQLQLFLDGPNDKLINVIMTDCAGTGPRVLDKYKSDPQIGYLAGKSVGDLVDCEQRATVTTLTKNQRPVRTFQIETVDERSLGALLMHFMLETIIAGKLMNIDPFDQPAVEQGKILTREYLATM